MEEKLGTRFGNYELVRRIDVGGMGEVYLAHQLTAFGRSVAIKIIRSDLVHDITARARFLREAEVSAHLKHEHILPLYDFGEVNGRLFLVTPYIEGGTLAARLKSSGPMSLVEAHKLFVALAQAVAYVHRRGVVHRDLKPTNVMLDTEDGEIYVRLIDFGIASLQGHSASPPLTMAGHEIGTIAYMAPERLSGIAAPSNDIFSLGVILHQMLTARIPTAAPPSPASAAPRLPEPLAQVVRRCVVANPAERYATVEELLKAFEQAYQQMINQAQPGMPAVVPGTPVPVTNGLSQDRHALATSRPELVSLAHSGEVPALVPGNPAQVASRAPEQAHFAPEDYNAPTTSFQAPQTPSRPPTNRPPLIKLPQQRQQQPGQKRKNPLLLALASAAVLILVIISAMLYYGYQVVSAASVSVNFAPQVRLISQVFSLKADPAAQTVNVAQATIPARVVTLSQTAHQTGATSGSVNCTFGVFNCQQGVSQSDVDGLVAQIQPGLEQSISQALQTKISTAHGTQASPVNFSNLASTPDPPVGTASHTVTVNLSEQGSVGYILNGDVVNVVRQLLAGAVAQADQGYQIVDATVNIGSPRVQGTDPGSGLISIKVAAGAVARYQFTQAQLQAITNGLQGLSLTAAEAFLKSQPGVDPTSVSIHFTSGSGQTMPGDGQHIKLIPLNPGILPTVPLTPVAGITPAAMTPTVNPTDTSTPTVNPIGTSTPTDNGN